MQYCRPHSNPGETGNHPPQSHRGGAKCNGTRHLRVAPAAGNARRKPRARSYGTTRKTVRTQTPTLGLGHPLLVSSIVLLYLAYTPNRRGGEGEEMAAL